MATINQLVQEFEKVCGPQPVNAHLTLEDGISISGRCVWGFAVGYITKVTRDTFTIGWRDGETTHLRPDDEEAEPQEERCSAADYRIDHARDHRKNGEAA